MRRVLVSLTLFCAALAVAPAARQATQIRPLPSQQPSLTFRSLANYVEVDAVVTDAAGEPARDLTCKDFEVQEDGHPQNLSVCALIDIPVEKPDPLLFRNTIVEPDVVSNEKPFDGRVFMIVLDAYHVAALRGISVKKQAAKFIDQYMGENDIAAVVHVGNGTVGQEFTGNKRLLKAAVSRFVGQALPSATVNIQADALAKDQMQSSQTSFPIDPGPPEDKDAGVREYMARESVMTMRRLAEYMGGLNGRRKALLLFSEGIGLDMVKIDDSAARTPETALFRPQQTDNQSVRLAEQDMIAAAAKSNVSIYSIDPRGITTGQEDSAQLGVGADVGGTGSILRDYSNPLVHSDAADESHRMQDSLRMYAEQTGGLAMVNQNDMDDAFRRIVKDNSSYYLLGYSSPDPRHDGRFHRVSVKVTRPGLRVRTRNGYYAPAEKASAKSAVPADPVVQMLVSPAPVGGLGMQATASVIKGLLLKSTVHLTLEFRGEDVALKSSGGLFTNDIDVEYLAVNMKGERQAGGREIAHLQLRPATRAALPQNGVRYVTEFDLAPGRYQVRVAAREHLGGRTGSVFCDIEVPDFSTLRLAMSDLLITSSGARRTPTPNSTSSIGGILPTPTTTVREFTTADTITVAASMYDNDTRAAHQVRLKASVQSDLGAQVFVRDEQQPNTALASAKGGFNWVVPVPLKGMAPGRYVLVVEATSTLSGVEPVRKETEFRIK